MKIAEIIGFPRTFDRYELKFIEGVPIHNKQSCHESLLRGFQILQKVKDWLKRGVPADVILELVEEMEHAPEPEESER